MKRFVEGTDRHQGTLFPECLEDWICEDNPVRVIDVFVDELDLPWADGDPLVAHQAVELAGRCGAAAVATTASMAREINPWRV